MLEYLTNFGIDYATLFLYNLVFSIIVISLEKRNTNTLLAWLFFMSLLPGIGFFFFLLLSQNISKRKIFKYTAEERELYQTYLKQQTESFRYGTFRFKDQDLRNYSDMFIFHNRLSQAIFS